MSHNIQNIFHHLCDKSFSSIIFCECKTNHFVIKLKSHFLLYESYKTQTYTHLYIHSFTAIHSYIHSYLYIHLYMYSEKKWKRELFNIICIHLTLFKQNKKKNPNTHTFKYVCVCGCYEECLPVWLGGGSMVCARMVS